MKYFSTKLQCFSSFSLVLTHSSSVIREGVHFFLIMDRQVCEAEGHTEGPPFVLAVQCTAANPKSISVTRGSLPQHHVPVSIRTKHPKQEK